MKTMKIVIKSQEESYRESMEWVRRFERGDRVKPFRSDSFESFEAVRAFLTDARLTLWRTIRDKKPSSITELARMVKRNYSDVHEDLRILKLVGLVSLRRPPKSKTRALKPVSLADKLSVEVA